MCARPAWQVLRSPLFSLISNVVQNPVRADAEAGLSRELQHHELTSEFLGPFALRFRISCKESDDSDNGGVTILSLDDETCLSLDDETCTIFGRHRGRLRAAGKTTGDFDLLIGSTGLRHGLKVLTNNRRHFTLIDGLLIESL